MKNTSSTNLSLNFKEKDLVQLTYDDRALGDNFKHLTSGILKLQQQLRQQIQRNVILQAKTDAKLDKIYKALLGGLQQANLQFGNKLKSVTTSVSQIQTNLLDKQAKLAELYVFKKNQGKLSQRFKSQMQELSTQQADVIKQLNKHHDQLNHKAEKLQMQKLKKDLPNIQLRLETAISLQKQMKQKIDRHSPFSDQEQVKKKLGEDTYNVVMVEVAAGLSRALSFKNKSGHQGERSRKDLVSNAVNKEEMQELRNKQQQQEVKLQRIIELQKSRQKLFYQLSTKRQSRGLLAEDEMRMQDMSKQVYTLSNRLNLFQQKLKGQDRKTDAMKLYVEEIEQRGRVLTQMRMQERLKQQQAQTFSLLKNLDSRIDTKADIELCSQLRYEFNQMIQGLIQTLAKKPDRQDIKKALLFIEAKVKQLSTFITEDSLKNYASASKFKLLTCLSCDKDIQSALPREELPPNNNSRFLPLSIERQNLSQSSFFKKRIRRGMKSQERTVVEKTE